MKLTAERNLKVNYYEKEKGKNIWIVVSQMIEEQHDIAVTTEIDMEQMIILDAKISFNCYPLNYCKAIESLAASLAGIKIDKHFSYNIMKVFLCPEGCPNVMTLLNIAIPGIIYYYYPYKIKTGEITQEQFYELLKENEKNACLAHTIMFAEDKKTMKANVIYN